MNQAYKARQVQLDHLDVQVQLVWRDLVVNQERLEPLVTKDLMDQLAHRVHQAPLAQRVRWVQQDQLVPVDP